MEETICPKCHATVRPTDYYCYNCGNNLKPAPPSTTVTTQIGIYLGSILLPPIGYIWGYKYLKQPDSKSKLIGTIAFALTTIIIVVAVMETISIINTVNRQVNSQMQNFIGF